MKLTREVLEAFRDTVLHQRGALAENGMTGDQINDVLSEFDACFDTTPCQSAGAVAPGECVSVPDGFLPMESAPLDGTEILLLTQTGIVSAWFAKGEWKEHYEYGREYTGAQWVCYDDKFQIEVEETEHGNFSEAIGWMPKPGQSGISSTPFRPNEQNAVQTEQPSLSNALDVYEAQTEALPLGHEIPERGESTYNWQTAAIRDIRALLAQGQDSDKDPMDWSLPCDVFVGHGTFKKGVKLRTLVARMKVLYEMATGKDADAIANGAPKE